MSHVFTIITLVEDSFPDIVEQIGGSVERKCVDMARAQAYCHGACYWSPHSHQHRNQPAFLQMTFIEMFIIRKFIRGARDIDKLSTDPFSLKKFSFKFVVFDLNSLRRTYFLVI